MEMEQEKTLKTERSDKRYKILVAEDVKLNQLLLIAQQKDQIAEIINGSLFR